MELLSRFLNAGDEDKDLGASSAALKAKQGLLDLRTPPPTMSPGVQLLTSDVKSCRGIRSSLMDSCPSPFHPRVSTVPVGSVGMGSEVTIRNYGLPALAPLATKHPSPPSGGAVTKVSQVREGRPLPRPTFISNFWSLIPKLCPSGRRNSPNFHSSRVSNMLTPGLSAHLSGSRVERNFFSGK